MGALSLVFEPTELSAVRRDTTKFNALRTLNSLCETLRTFVRSDPSFSFHLLTGKMGTLPMADDYHRVAVSSVLYVWEHPTEACRSVYGCGARTHRTLCAVVLVWLRYR
jgi:hypothetical protein